MARSDFLAELRVAAQDAGGFFNSSGRKWLAAIMAGQKEHDDHTPLDIDRIYELMCYFCLLASLSLAGRSLRFIPGGGAAGYRLPYSPADKSNFAFFRIHLDGNAYDLCCGTGIPAPLEADNGLEHPDISLQRMPSLDAPPLPGALVAMWDAKFHSGDDLSKGDIAQMHMWSTVLQLPPCTAGDVVERLCPPAFQVSGIITNVKRPPGYGALLLSSSFSVVLGFEGNVHGCSPFPSREEHLAHRVAPKQPPTAPAAPMAPSPRRSRHERV